MNNGKICVSVCAGTAGELIKQIRQAEAFADIIEIRFDCLNEDQLLKAVSLINSEKPLAFTYRPREQGGKTDVERRARIDFWNTLARAGRIDQRKDRVDLEFDLKSEISSFEFRKILSFHDLERVPENLEAIAEGLSDNDAIIKIAVRTADIPDTVLVWELFQKAKSESQQMIPIAIGEAGKWTRILGLAHGAPMTYASLDAGRETAPGQVSALDLAEVYRVKDLDEDTKVYGIIGGNTSYTMSPYLHNAAFKFHRLNSVFVPLQVWDLERFMCRMVLEKTREIELNFNGFAVTNPHKREIIRYLHELDETADAIGAVNTVRIENGKLLGFNTDAQGFIGPLKTAWGDLPGANVGVFGTGGAARACIYALRKEGADVTVFTRNPAEAKLLGTEFDVSIEPIPDLKSQIQNLDIVVNATPLGTRGELEDDSILTAGQLEGVKLVYDLVYNPFETKFLREAAAAGVPSIGGFAMLIAQAAAQQEIWTGLGAPLAEMSSAVVKRIARAGA